MTASGYDDLDRVIYTGEWDIVVISDLRSFFLNPSWEGERKRPFAEELTPGTVTRTFYDKALSQDSLDALGVKILPDGETLEYTRGRVAAIISDVKAVYNDDGTPKQAADGKDSVIRVSTANSYDKYGRVIASYSFDPTMPEDSLKKVWSSTEYDLGGKVVSVTKYPYGSTFGGAIFRAVTERYTYDRLGRVSYIDAKNGTAPLVELAHYEYYPTGSVKTVTLGNSLTISYTYHISGAVKTAAVISAKKDGPNPDTLYSEKLYYEDCGSSNCAQYNGNISRMKQLLAHGSNSGDRRDATYLYDELNRLINVNDSKQDVFDEIFAYDAQGRITMQRRGANAKSSVTSGGEYSYEGGTNKLKSVASGMGGTTADERNMSDTANFVYDSEGNLVEDKSKRMKISYDWRGMPIEFKLQDEENSSDSTRLAMMYDGSGRRISKTLLTKPATATSWETVKVTHYTGIGTEIREEFHNGSRERVSVVVNMPQGLGRYKVADASQPADDNASRTFEWYLKNHLGSTMLVYGTVASTDPNNADIGETKAAYDYRAFGEQVELLPHDLAKVTENFTGKEHDDEIALDYFGARYLDPMLGLWISVDPKRQFSSPYLYAGNGMNPVNVIDPDGNWGWLAWIFIGTGTIIGVNSCMNTMDEGLDWSANAAQTYGRTTVDGPVSQEQLHATNESARDFMKDTFLGVFSLGSSGAGSNKLIESAGNILHAIQNWFTDKKTAPPEPPQPESPPLEQNFNEKN